jgi:pyruvate dehydrogenase E2 component (dihydrolipoamide acetyltransferase)
MPIQVLMPALSPTMTDGKLTKWLKSEGEQVSSGDLLAEIETDKATMEVEAVDEGILGKILVAEGTEGVAVNSPIALILEEGEDESALEGALEGVAAVAAPKPVQAATPEPTPAPQVVSTPQGGRVFASPLARRMAAAASIDIATITGSGPHGRIIKRDVEAALATGGPAPATATEIAVPGGYREIPNTTMRKVIAARLQESVRTAPHFYLTVDCLIDELLDTRKRLNAKSPEGDGAYKISVNDFIIKAVAYALREVPEANAAWTDEAIRIYNEIDVSVAVATPGGLITPVVRGADCKGLAEISKQVKDLAARGREGKLAPEEYQGGGFTISNLGMYGIREFAAIINPPQSCILAVGAGEPRAVVADGALAIATVMTVTLAVDHRSVDGALGATFLQAFKRFIEEPLTMLL